MGRNRYPVDYQVCNLLAKPNLYGTHVGGCHIWYAIAVEISDRNRLRKLFRRIGHIRVKCSISVTEQDRYVEVKLIRYYQIQVAVAVKISYRKRHWRTSSLN